MVDRITVHTIGPDPRSAALVAGAHLIGLSNIASIDVADVYFVEGDLSLHVRAELEALVVDPLLQRGAWSEPIRAATGDAIETALLPGVTDSVATAVLDAAAVLDLPIRAAATGHRYVVETADGLPLAEDVLHRLATRLLSNAVIERVALGSIAPAFAHAVTPAPVELIEVRGLTGDQLAALNVERGMALDPAELRAIADHFTAAGRAPTDVELETLAQTWSEHCAHKTFRAAITLGDSTTLPSLLAQLRASTDRIDAPFVRSAFVGNAGIVSYTAGTTIAIKAETHNHPSAIEPFGGANTGVGGVIRDVMGAAHRPIACTDVLCFGPSDLPADQLPGGVIHPQLVRDGVVSGVADYGNKIGLPTVAGAVLYDPGYTANPLVFCGCIGVAPERPPLTGPHPGDLAVVLGGRTGRDGLRGATFSSATMDATTGDVAGASVQIGDPITEKLLIDLLEQADGLYSAITDCGAGGLSSAIGEMAEHVGADVDVALAPLKYPGLAPWEIWLSEAQERMVVAVPPEYLDSLSGLADQHGVELTVLGTFTGDGVLRVRSSTEVVLELDTAFLHDGRPQRTMTAELPTPLRNGAVPSVDDPAATLLALLAHPNIASKEAIIRRYDHEIMGSTVVRPLVGAAADAPADGVVLAEPSSRAGIAIGHGVNPWYGVADPERMAHAVVDEALRNVVACGADPDMVSLMDNFSWGDPRRPRTLGELVVTVQALCESAEAHGAPFISGKDSLNNEYLGADGLRHSVPPTLVITAIAHVPDADRAVTPDLAAAGDVLVLLGRTAAEFGGSHLGALMGGFGHLPDAARQGTVPGVDPTAHERYRRLHTAILTGRVQACHDVSEGGLAVALAEMAIGGRLGVDVDAAALPHDDAVVALFAESTGRFVVELEPDDVDWFVAHMAEPVRVLGTVVAEPVVAIGPCRVSLNDAVRAFTGAAFTGVTS
jgi:phosphoribosylformylglycinamidine synthase subunit PurSL